MTNGKVSVAKGHLISKCLFGVLNSSKKQTKKFNLTKCYATSGRIIIVHFLEEFKTQKRYFEINWPLEKTQQFWAKN